MSFLRRLTAATAAMFVAVAGPPLAYADELPPPELPKPEPTPSPSAPAPSVTPRADARRTSRDDRRRGSTTCRADGRTSIDAGCSGAGGRRGLPLVPARKTE